MAALYIAHAVTVLLILTKVTVALHRGCERRGSVCASSRIVMQEERIKFSSSIVENQKIMSKMGKIINISTTILFKI